MSAGGIEARISAKVKSLDSRSIVAFDKHPAGVDVGDSVRLLLVNHANSRARLHNMYQKVRSALEIEKVQLRGS